MKPWTTRTLRAAKGRQRLACLTAYDTLTGRLLDAAGIPLILVGDSLATTVLGHSTTLPATVEIMLHHTAAVTRGVRDALVVADLPFLSYAGSREQSLRNAGRFLQEAGADAVKLEGGRTRAATIAALVDNGIPVLGHIGVLPQSVHAAGYAARGRDAADAEALLADARAVADAGAFGLVLECVAAGVAAQITERLPIPTIGIGSGPSCDGQILVLADLLGLTPEPLPRFVRRFARLDEQIAAALATYREAVDDGSFPTATHSY